MWRYVPRWVRASQHVSAPSPSPPHPPSPPPMPSVSVMAARANRTSSRSSAEASVFSPDGTISRLRPILFGVGGSVP